MKARAGVGENEDERGANEDEGVSSTLVGSNRHQQSIQTHQTVRKGKRPRMLENTPIGRIKLQYHFAEY
jgi:hypothetical protein